MATSSIGKEVVLTDEMVFSFLDSTDKRLIEKKLQEIKELDDELYKLMLSMKEIEEKQNQEKQEIEEIKKRMDGRRELFYQESENNEVKSKVKRKLP